MCDKITIHRDVPTQESSPNVKVATKVPMIFFVLPVLCVCSSGAQILDAPKWRVPLFSWAVFNVSNKK